MGFFNLIYKLQSYLLPNFLIPMCRIIVRLITALVATTLALCDNTLQEMQFWMHCVPLDLLREFGLRILGPIMFVSMWPFWFWVGCILFPSKRGPRHLERCFGKTTYPRRYALLSAYQLGNEHSNAALLSYEWSLLGPRTIFKNLAQTLTRTLHYGQMPHNQSGAIQLFFDAFGHLAMIIHLYKILINKPQKLLKPCAYTSAFEAYASAKRKGMFHSIFNNDTVIVDNSATVHVCNDKTYFVGPLKTVAGVIRTIDKRPVQVTQMGSVRWEWKAMMAINMLTR